VAFSKQTLSTAFASEGATILDANKDGHPDVASGTWWYEGPAFERRHEFRPPREFPIDEYSESFLSFASDFNRDGWDDVLVVGFPGAAAHWYENPRGNSGHWTQRLVLEAVDNESPWLVQVVGDARPELICMHGGFLGYAELDQANPHRQWRFVPITENRGYQRFTHGLGAGDLSGDGRPDIAVREGWFEQPVALEVGKPWRFHEFLFSEPGGAQMLIADVDGDGANDLVTSKAAHAYGLAWFEGKREGNTTTFREHTITGESASESEFGVAFSQAHGLAMADVNGDGVADFVTGKRWWAHGKNDPGSLEPAVLYWFRAERSPSGFRFIPELVDTDSGVGTQVTVGRLNKDSLPDILVGNKKGAFVFLQQPVGDSSP
jgi:hypothetical protein